MNIYLNGLIMDRMRPTRKIITIQMDSDDPDRMQIRFGGLDFSVFRRVGSQCISCSLTCMWRDT